MFTPHNAANQLAKRRMYYACFTTTLAAPFCSTAFAALSDLNGNIVKILMILCKLLEAYATNIEIRSGAVAHSRIFPRCRFRASHLDTRAQA
jgi:hypothetical protein